MADHPPLVDAAGAGPSPPPIQPAPPALLPATAASSASAPLSARRGEQRAIGINAEHFEREEAARRRETATTGKDKRAHADVWQVIHRLTPTGKLHLKLTMGEEYGAYTHVCRARVCDAKGEPLEEHCDQLLKINRNNSNNKDGLGPYITTAPIKHCGDNHQGTAAAIAMVTRVGTLAHARQQAMLAGGLAGAKPRGAKPSAQGTLAMMVLTPGQRALSAQARFFIYSQQSISKSTMIDESFRAMIRCNDKLEEPTPVLSFKMIDKWIQAEFDIFQLFLREVMALKYKQASPP